jgi:D-alanine transaminase
MQPLANINGKTMPLSEATVSAQDRGFLFGDAVYEVLRIYAGKPWLEEGHFRRFEESLRAIHITGVDVNRMRQRMHETIRAGGFREATAYLQVTRGAAPRSHVFPVGAPPLEFLFVKEYEDTYANAREHGTGVITYPDIRWERCDIKSTNLLANVMAMQDAKEAGCSEAILYLPDGTLTECSHSSFFGVLEGTILTAPKSPAILPGITRELVLSLAARAGLPEREQMLKRDDLRHVSELFLTGTTTEVMPITQVDGKPIADGKPGPVTRRLQEVYRQAVREFIE